ncbi:RING finger protein 122-like [Amphiura filiformis]|uniref:RING finger protein 122-like n=1 Tax=Amphiura filiformis TaxID=82378 RepID=UPI003B21563F
MCSLVLFLIFSCYDQYERRNNESIKKDAFKQMKYSSKKVHNDTCAVCLEEFHAKEKIGVCRCHHGFHVKCISTWVATKSTCPICKARVVNRHRHNNTAAAAQQPVPTPSG